MTSLLAERMEQGRSLLRQHPVFAVVGASQDHEKYGHEVLDALWQRGFTALPINPRYAEIDGQPCYPTLDALPQKVDVVVTAVPPAVTGKVVETCVQLRIGTVWMPPETSNESILEFCAANGIQVIEEVCLVFALKSLDAEV